MGTAFLATDRSAAQLRCRPRDSLAPTAVTGASA